MTNASADIGLSCQPGKEGSCLVFPYEVRNHGTADVYVMDAMPSVERPGGKGGINARALVVLHGPGDDVTLGRFIAPLPTDRRLAVPVVPLARHLVPGEVLQGRIEVPLPVAESSPYYPELLLRQYEIIDVQGVAVSIGYWIAGADGLAAMPVDDAPGLFAVVTRNTVRSAKRVSLHFPTRALQLFRRTDQFPRNIPGDPDPASVEGGMLGSWTGRPGGAALTPAYA
jgi:hypothetical protein